MHDLKRFGLYPSSSATLRTRSSTSGRTFPLLFNTRSTVPLETPDSSAICRIVTSQYLSLSVMTEFSFIRPPVHPESSKAFLQFTFVLPATSQTIHLLFTSSTVARIGFCNAFPFSVNTTSIKSTVFFCLPDVRSVPSSPYVSKNSGDRRVL